MFESEAKERVCGIEWLESKRRFLIVEDGPIDVVFNQKDTLHVIFLFFFLSPNMLFSWPFSRMKLHYSVLKRGALG